MTNLIKRHRAAADSHRRAEGNAHAALCKLHDETANYIEELEEELDRFRNGYKGSCYACEPVGEENERLRAALRFAYEPGCDCEAYYEIHKALAAASVCHSRRALRRLLGK